jgi:hypothetical protein
MSAKYAYTFESFRKKENKKTDRILILKVIDGKKPISSIGLTDPRLFSGENKLHAIQESGLWSLKYEQGRTPPELRQQFTGFNTLVKHVTDYYKKRNVEIKEILD